MISKAILILRQLVLYKNVYLPKFFNMILSMTGFGKASLSLNERTVNIEVRSVNSKFLDFRAKLPTDLATLEFELKKMVNDQLLRGKVDMLIEISKVENGIEEVINKEAFRNFFTQISTIVADYNISDADIVQAILKIPAIYDSTHTEFTQEQLQQVIAAANSALKALNEFRAEEGRSIYEDFKLRIRNIRQASVEIGPFENQRIVRLREKLVSSLEENFPNQNYDESRLEQELIFYIEKLDITEEKVRLEQHCKYFLEVLESAEISKGKKLAFIVQEIGREINTLGSKANAYEIQKIVVTMKDDLEKIKEQVANIM